MGNDNKHRDEDADVDTDMQQSDELQQNLSDST